MLYPKIPGPFIRDSETNRLTDIYRTAELEVLADSKWIMLEKIDGMNIRIIWDGYKVSYAGRTDAAQLHPELVAYLDSKFGGPDNEELFEQKFGDKPVVIYGEGFGAGIQKGGCYKDHKSFVVFDILIGEMFLLQDDIEDIASYFNVDVLKPIATGTLKEAINIVSGGLKSTYGDFIAEGLVCKTVTGLKDRRGDRIIVKIKTRDFM